MRKKSKEKVSSCIALLNQNPKSLSHLQSTGLSFLIGSLIL